MGKALDVAESIGPLRINVNCAGIGNAAKTLGKDGPFPLDAFKKVIEVNLIGTFNVLRLSAERIAKTRAHRLRSAVSSSTPRRSRRSRARSARPRTRRPRAESSA